MWTLECDGDILEGKRIWLRPGQSYLFGRTKVDGGRYKSWGIAHKTVSRKHLTLSVSAVKPGEGSLIHTRSAVTLEDGRTKFGTEVDGETLLVSDTVEENVNGKKELVKKLVHGGVKVLKSNEHVIKLGKYEHLFRIKRQPVVLSFQFPTKKAKRAEDPLIAVRARLEDLDIKTIIPYVIDKTTHVVANKRNTAKGLQALINGKFIVQDSYLDAIVYATTPGNLDEPESLSPLEEDFDANWPNARDHLPPPSKEPGQQSADLFAPNPARRNVFDGYTFVFLEQLQLDTLHSVITNGGGKALLFNLIPGKTTAEEIVRFVKNAASEKGLGEFEGGSEGRGVVVVKFRLISDFEDWTIQTQQQVALALDQRLIEQNEFLDVILTNDPSKLRRALPVEDVEVNETPNQTAASTQKRNSMQHPPANNEPTSAQPGISQPPTRRTRTRGTIVSQFKGFDDGFEPSTISTPKREFGDSSQSAFPNGASRQNSYGVSFADSAMDSESQGVDESITQTRSSKKRPLPSEDEDEDEMNESMLPAAAAMKRRRIEEEKDARRKGLSVEPSFEKPKEAEVHSKKRKPRKEVNIQDVVRERREKEEEAARRDEEDLHNPIDGMNVDEMKHLAIVEEMEVTERTDRPRRNVAHLTSDRWDEQWNGRKNFKKFQHRGEGPQPRRGKSVMIALEEVKKKDYGIGEGYWLESEKSQRRRKGDEGASQSQSQAIITARSHQAEALEELTDGADHEVIDVEAPRTTRLADKTKTTGQRTSRPANEHGKRLAPTQGRGRPPKIQKTLAARESDSDTEDELKFKFVKNRK